MTISDFTRWLYRGQRPNWIAKILNRASAAVASSGVASNYLVTLEVTGRQSGRTVSLPLVMAVVDGQRYLVSMLGDNVQWVHNVRASGGRAVLRSGAREEIQLEEVPADQRAPILRAYLAASTWSATSRAREQRCSTCGVPKGRRGVSGFPSEPSTVGGLTPAGLPHIIAVTLVVTGGLSWP